MISIFIGWQFTRAMWFYLFKKPLEKKKERFLIDSCRNSSCKLLVSIFLNLFSLLNIISFEISILWSFSSQTRGRIRISTMCIFYLQIFHHNLMHIQCLSCNCFSFFTYHFYRPNWRSKKRSLTLNNQL